MKTMPQKADSQFADKICIKFVTEIAEKVYQGSRDFRVTLFVRGKDPNHIEPLYRWFSGKAQKLSEPRIQFPPGKPVAGLAWQEPGKVFVLKLPEFKTDEEVEKYYKGLGLSEEIARKFRCGHMIKFRSVLCLGLHENKDDLPIVLSVDSRLAQGFVMENPKSEKKLRNAAPLRDVLRRFVPRLRKHLTRE
ncbi:MAG: hypothetical protein HYU64_10800 [Armatimonadetes bacterium]|nr:hypothetical protein [Armatimonadota bacterium]